MKYHSGQIPKVGDNIQNVKEDEDFLYVHESVCQVNEDGTIDIEISGMGIIDSIDPSNYVLLENEWRTFWETAAKSKEEDVLECEWDGRQNIVNNGDYTFLWEESWEHVKLSGEFLGAKWRIKTR
ncbi:hypothetical protein [Metabacillus fastidiosus]|uniref:hypothetical protein n=1 Tax=Metabacillus fastidiosus TaxID=1458 RepID=UPI003D27C496